MLLKKRKLEEREKSLKADKERRQKAKGDQNGDRKKTPV